MKRDSVYPYQGKGPPGTTIHHLRLAMGWSLRDLGKRCKLDHTTIARYEKNEQFTQDGLERVAKIFGVKLEVLFCPPEVAEIYRLPKKARDEVLKILELTVSIYRQGESNVP